MRVQAVSMGMIIPITTFYFADWIKGLSVPVASKLVCSFVKFCLNVSTAQRLTSAITDLLNNFSRPSQGAVWKTSQKASLVCSGCLHMLLLDLYVLFKNIGMGAQTYKSQELFLKTPHIRSF